MNAEFLIGLPSRLHHLHTVIAFASALIWFTAYYILNQMYRLKFLRWLLAGSILHLLDWFHTYFIPHGSTGDAVGWMRVVWQPIFVELKNVIPATVSTIGAIMGVMWLQDRFREFNTNKNASPSPEGHPPTGE